MQIEEFEDDAVETSTMVCSMIGRVAVADLGFLGVSVARPVPRVLSVGRALCLIILSRETARFLRLRTFGRMGFVGDWSLSDIRFDG